MENGYVTRAQLYKTLAAVFSSAAVIVSTVFWQAFAQHNSTPHPVTSDRIVEAKKDVAEQVRESEKRIAAQLDKTYQEQRAIDDKLDWIIEQMIEEARRGDNR